LIEVVVAYLSSVGLQWSGFDAVASILSRIVRLVVAAESTPQQRQELLRRLEGIDDWSAPNLVTTQLHSEWAIAANPFLIFMERCATAYCARSSAAIWRHFDDRALPTLKQLRMYMLASARGDLVRADQIVEIICARVRACRNGETFNVGSEPRFLSA